MGKLKLTQAEIDKIVVVDRVAALPTVYGLGKNDMNFQGYVGGKRVWQYVLWKAMLKRCFDEKLKARQSTYKDVTCCDEWLSFANFLEWLNKEVGYSGKPEGMELDKDILVRGNRVYSPEACPLVPRAVNSLLNSNGNSRGKYPQGVNYRKKTGKFVVQLSVGGKQKTLGYYNNPEDAFSAYKIAKEAHIKVVALQHKDVLKPAVFESLMSWEVTP